MWNAASSESLTCNLKKRDAVVDSVMAERIWSANAQKKKSASAREWVYEASGPYLPLSRSNKTRINSAKEHLLKSMMPFKQLCKICTINVSHRNLFLGSVVG